MCMWGCPMGLWKQAEWKPTDRHGIKRKCSPSMTNNHSGWPRLLPTEWERNPPTPPCPPHCLSTERLAPTHCACNSTTCSQSCQLPVALPAPHLPVLGFASSLSKLQKPSLASLPWDSPEKAPLPSNPAPAPYGQCLWEPWPSRRT